MFGCERPHLLKQVEFNLLSRLGANRGQAIRAKADVHPGALQSGERKRCVRKEIMAARTMHHARPVPCEQSRIASREVIDVDRHEVRAERIVAREQSHRGNSAAITHLTIIVFKPVMQFAARVLEHLELGD